LLCSLNFSYTFCCSQILILCFPWCWSWFKKLLFLRFWCCVSLNCAFLNWCYFDASVFHDCFWNVLISMHFSVTYIYIRFHYYDVHFCLCVVLVWLSMWVLEGTIVLFYFAQKCLLELFNSCLIFDVCGSNFSNTCVVRLWIVVFGWCFFGGLNLMCMLWFSECVSKNKISAFVGLMLLYFVIYIYICCLFIYITVHGLFRSVGLLDLFDLAYHWNEFKNHECLCSCISDLFLPHSRCCFITRKIDIYCLFVMGVCYIFVFW